MYDFDIEVLNPFFSEDYLKQKDGSKKEKLKLMCCVGCMPRVGIFLCRGQPLFVLLSASFLQIAVQLLEVPRHVKHQDQLGVQVCGHNYVSSL